jgi:branched-subunit amino acid transport protein
MDQKVIFWTIVGMGVVTYLPRLLPTLFLAGRDLRPIIISWLRLVPPAVLSAMLVPSLLVREDKVNLTLENLFLWAGLVAFVVACRYKSLFLTVIVGMGLVAAGRYFSVGF